MLRPPTAEEATWIRVACHNEWKFCKRKVAAWWLDKSMRRIWCEWMRQAWLGYRYAKEC